jgi:NAD(P)-dependent dehydrogenase (short-subunit alcohol dehydrogenase family)
MICFLNKVVALETAGSGVTSNAVCPGWTLTPSKQDVDMTNYQVIEMQCRDL